MQELFSQLTHAIQGAPIIALSAAAVWGILSVLLSPCHLASIPLIVGFISDQGPLTLRRAFWISTLFATGILVTIAAIGVITAGAGRMLGDVGRYGNYFVALVFFVVGLHLLGAIPLPLPAANQPAIQRKGLLAALLLGLIFGVALGPCTFAYLAPLLGIAFQVGRSAPWYAASLLLAYGIGHCAVIVVAGTSTERVQRFLNWNENSNALTRIKRICGAAVIAGGLWMLYAAP